MRTAGEHIGVYTLNAPLGQGAFGEVWRATSPHGPVAVKLLKIQEGWARRRFEREAEVLSKLGHVNCVALVDYGVARDGTPFIVTELVHGETLTNWFRDKPIGTRLQVARQIAEAMAYAHSLNIVHRDLKPDNILVTASTTNPQVKVLDFGLARLVNSSPRDITETGEVIGTPGYMSPEQLRGTPDLGTASDVYSLGAVFFLLLEGRPPFEASSMLEVAMQHLTEPPPPLSAGHRADIAALVARMLSKDPRKRPRSSDVARALVGRFELANSGRSARAPHDVPRPDEGRDRLRWTWLAAAGLVVSVVLGAALVQFSSGPEERAIHLPPNEHPLAAPRAVLSPDDDVPARPTEDVGLPDLASPELPPALPLPARESDGCQLPRTKHLRPGVHELDGTDLSLFVRIPRSYRPRRPAPVLILIHDIGQRPEEILASEGLAKRADREGFVLIAPQGSTPMPDVPILRHLPLKKDWVDPAESLRVIKDVEIAATRACLDRHNVFVLGHGNGGVAAEWVAGQMPVRALMTSAHRMWGSLEPCTLNRPVPTLFIAPVNDPAAPVFDQPDCFGTTSKWNLAKQEAVFTSRNRCSGEPRPIEADHAECFTADCEVDFVWCRAEGGRDWKSMPSRKVTSGEDELGIRSFCASPKGEFDYVGTFWDFVQKYRLPKP